MSANLEHAVLPSHHRRPRRVLLEPARQRQRSGLLTKAEEASRCADELEALAANGMVRWTAVYCARAHARRLRELAKGDG